MFDIQKMMQQAQQMQQKMQEMQEKFKDIEIQSQSGGGMVKVTMTCTGVVQSVDIDPSLLSDDNKEVLEDLITAAMNQANELREDRVQKESQQMMMEAGLDPNAMGGLPF
ncbi:MAG: YbaB/EbfC family nucleoid-associated protein [Alphaproteobacteria bacterium]|nr:YbaB/EbfC family nucleoid-associated protein [Alphaproteobacteria bacterium]|tara:strand:+ start:1364 stop:1693 length:330 start_codon:yes stop_codon:yes gene_type:complete